MFVFIFYLGEFFVCFCVLLKVSIVEDGETPFVGFFVCFCILIKSFKLLRMGKLLLWGFLYLFGLLLLSAAIDICVSTDAFGLLLLSAAIDICVSTDAVGDMSRVAWPNTAVVVVLFC